jgi:uncharacterized membrane protein YhiD involved in acid resistance
MWVHLSYLITILVIIVVKSSLALSLGLLGVLSIVRFRTPIKEPEELAYIFMAIAIGFGLGADQTIPTLVATPVILAAMASFKLARSNNNNKSLLLSVDWKAQLPREQFDEINQLINKHVKVSDLRRFDSNEHATDVTFNNDVENPSRLFDLENEIRQTFSGVSLTFIDQRQSPTFLK